MTFAEAEQQLIALRERRRLGELPDAAYIEAVNAVRVLDDRQVWWQPDPYSEGWLCWDGAAWQPATPPVAADTPASLPAAAEAPAAAAAAVSAAAPAETEVVALAEEDAATPKSGLREWATGVQQHVQAQASDPQTFLRIARSLPLRLRPESWWNALSIFGGAASGYFWFVYGSVSGLPTPGFLVATPLAKYSRFLVPLVLLFIPILLLLFRNRFAGPLSRLQQKFGRFSLAKKVALVIGVPVVLYYFPSAYTMIIARVPFLSRFSFLQFNFGEGVDFITPLMMVGLPIAFIYLRKPIDGFLSRFSFLRKIPAPLRIGLGIAMPFLTAYLLFLIGFTEYPLLRVNVLLGTALSYLMVRTPRLFTSSGKASPPVTPAVASVLLLLGLAALVVVLADPAWADCFLTDPFNFNDGLRTNGVAPILAGVATTTVSLLVNGVEIARTVIQDTGPVKEGEDPKHTQFTVRVELQDAKGVRSSRLSPKETEPLFLFAHCENEQGAFPAGDPTINMVVTTGQEWVVVTEERVPNTRCWRLVMPDPQPKTAMPQSVEIVISAGQGGGLISVPVHLWLDIQTIMHVKMVNGNTFSATGRTYTVYDAWVNNDKKGWLFGEMVIFWCKPEDTDTPISTRYSPVEWTLAAKPDYFIFDPPTPTSDDGNLTWRTHAALKPDIKIPNDWQEADGIIEVRVTCRTTSDPAP